MECSRVLWLLVRGICHNIYMVKTAILSWLQNDGNRWFSKDQLYKGKQLSPTFRPDALVVFRVKVKLGAKIALLKGMHCTA